MRVLITGSREVTDDDEAAVEKALLDAVDSRPGPHTLVHGGAKGADTIAARVAYRLGWTVERHRADWAAECRTECDHGGRRPNKYGPGTMCPAQGNYRNAKMVDLGADVCVAVFKRGAANKGTSDCKSRAVSADIDVKPVVV